MFRREHLPTRSGFLWPKREPRAPVMGLSSAAAPPAPPASSPPSSGSSSDLVVPIVIGAVAIGLVALTLQKNPNRHVLTQEERRRGGLKTQKEYPGRNHFTTETSRVALALARDKRGE